MGKRQRFRGAALLLPILTYATWAPSSVNMFGLLRWKREVFHTEPRSECHQHNHG